MPTELFLHRQLNSLVMVLGNHGGNEFGASENPDQNWAHRRTGAHWARPPGNHT